MTNYNKAAKHVCSGFSAYSNHNAISCLNAVMPPPPTLPTPPNTVYILELQ